jgi:hypothetical protein
MSLGTGGALVSTITLGYTKALHHIIVASADIANVADRAQV